MKDDLINRQAAIEALEKNYEPDMEFWYALADVPTADVRDYATAHKIVGGGERDGSTCWFECDNCGLAVDISDVFCKHCGARFVP